MAAALHFLGHHNWNHHSAAAAGRRGAAGPWSQRSDKNADIRRRVLRLRRPHPVADRISVLLRSRVHQDGIGQPNRVPIRVSIRQHVVRIGIQFGSERSPFGAGDPIRVRQSRRHLSAIGEISERGLRQQCRRWD